MSTSRNTGTRLGEAAAENPGRAALLSLVTTPLAMRAGRVALNWARRNPGMALVVAAGALAWWGTQSMRRNGSANAFDGDAATDDGSFDFPGAAHGSVGGYGRDAGASSRSTGGDDSSASSL